MKNLVKKTVTFVTNFVSDCKAAITSVVVTGTAAVTSLCTSVPVHAVPDVTDVVAEIEGWTGVGGPALLVGGAIVTAAALFVGYKWIKGMIFS
jgi:hypothetical protein